MKILPKNLRNDTTLFGKLHEEWYIWEIFLPPPANNFGKRKIN